MKTKTEVELTMPELIEALRKGLPAAFFERDPSFLKGDGEFIGRISSYDKATTLDMSWTLDETEAVVESGGNGVAAATGLEPQDFGPAFVLYIRKDAVRTSGTVQWNLDGMFWVTKEDTDDVWLRGAMLRHELCTLVVPKKGKLRSAVDVYGADGLLASYIPANRDNEVFAYYKVPDNIRDAVRKI